MTDKSCWVIDVYLTEIDEILDKIIFIYFIIEEETQSTLFSNSLSKFWLQR
jgi:hypothetical protein